MEQKDGWWREKWSQVKHWWVRTFGPAYYPLLGEPHYPWVRKVWNWIIGNK